MNKHQLHDDTVIGIKEKLNGLAGQERMEYLLGLLDGMGIWSNLTGTANTEPKLVEFHGYLLAEQQRAYSDKHELRDKP